MQYTALIPAFVYFNHKISPHLTFDRCFCTREGGERKSIINLTQYSRFHYYDKWPEASGKVLSLIDLAIRVGAIALLDCCLKAHLSSSTLNPIRVLYLVPIITKIVTCFFTDLEKQLNSIKRSETIEKFWKVEDIASKALLFTLLTSVFLPIFSLKIDNDRFSPKELKLLVSSLKILMSVTLASYLPKTALIFLFKEENLEVSKGTLLDLDNASHFELDFDHMDICLTLTDSLGGAFQSLVNKEMRTFQKAVYAKLYDAQLKKYLTLLDDLNHKLDILNLEDLPFITHELRDFFYALKSHKEEAELLIRVMLARNNQSEFFKTPDDARKLKEVYGPDVELIKDGLTILSNKYETKLQRLITNIKGGLTLNDAFDSFETLDHRSTELFNHMFYEQLLKEFIPKQSIISNIIPDDPDKCLLLFDIHSKLVDLKGETITKLIHLCKLMKFGGHLHSIWKSGVPLETCRSNIQSEEFFARLKIALTAKNPQGEFRVLKFNDSYAGQGPFFKKCVWKHFVNHPIEPHEGPFEIIDKIVLPHNPL